MNEDISTKQWCKSDWQIFKSIRLEALRKNAAAFGASYDAENSQDDKFWQDRLSNPDNGTIFGLYDRDDVIGLTGIYRDWNGREGVAVLCMSYLRQEYRGRVLSDLLYKARIDWAKAQGDIRILEVAHREGNDASRGANQRWGFILTEVKNQVYGNGENAKDYVYQLKI